MTQAEREYYESNTMATYTGRRVNPLALKPEDIDIRDIAHALSQICRFNGHCKRFYSVAEHSWLVSRIAAREVAKLHGAGVGESAEVAACGLLHDAGEAYLGDIIRPLRCRQQYKLIDELQENVQAQLFAHFGVHDYDIVHTVDRKLVLVEGAQLFPNDVSVQQFPATQKYSEWHVGMMSPDEAEDAFLARFKALGLEARLAGH